MDNIEKMALGGKEAWTLHPEYLDGELVAYYVYFIDEECDPITVEIDVDGNARLPVSISSYAMMTADSLRKLARLCAKAKRLHAA